MKKEDLLIIGLTEDQAEKVVEIYLRSLRGFIPKTRFDDVNKVKKDLRQQIKNKEKEIELLQDKLENSRRSENKIRLLKAVFEEFNSEQEKVREEND